MKESVDIVMLFMRNEGEYNGYLYNSVIKRTAR